MMLSKDKEVSNKIREQYLGEKHKELREGFGVYVYENKFFRYEGEWAKGKKHGHGKLLMADGSYYEGQFNNGEIRGHGFRYWSTSGNKYAGQFEKGELHGRGVMEYKDGTIYEGDWHRNVREGRGKLTDKNGQVYEGEFHNHKRHGEGRQTFTNGDIYDGNWIIDRRQGHGYLEQPSGTSYDGQWLHDAFSGHGRMEHCSGVIYEGPWVRGLPTNPAAELFISNGPTIQCAQGLPFEVVVEVRTAEGEVLTLETGRELRVSAWFRARPTSQANTAAPSPAEAGNSGPLLDLIEETEEKTRSTPYGYEVVPFPLTDELPVREASFISPEYSNMAQVDEEEGEDVSAQPTEESPLAAVAEEGSKDDPEKTEVNEYGVEPTEDTPSNEVGAAEDILVEQEDTSASLEITQEESPPMPPVPNVRTDEGCAVWETLLLPLAPTLYRPYALLDEEAGIPPAGSKDAKAKAKDKRRLTAKDREKLEDREEATSPNVEAADGGPSEDSKAKYKRLGDPKFARPGEYVIMVEDVTEPPFLDVRLEPAFLKIELQAPRRERRSTIKKPEEKKKQWSTEEMIARSMARASVVLVEKDVSRFRESRETG